MEKSNDTCLENEIELILWSNFVLGNGKEVRFILVGEPFSHFIQHGQHIVLLFGSVVPEVSMLSPLITATKIGGRKCECNFKLQSRIAYVKNKV